MPTTIADIIESVHQRIAELNTQHAAETDEALSRWVVMSSAQFPLAFDVSEAGGVTNPRCTSVGNASRFTRTMAYHVARRTRDGNGRMAKPLKVEGAYTVVLHELTMLLGSLRCSTAQEQAPAPANCNPADPAAVHAARAGNIEG